MQKYFELLLDTPLFRNVKPDELKQLLNCLSPQLTHFLPEQPILLAGEPANRIGVLLEGRAQVIRETYTGDRSILTALHTGDLFAEAFACASGPCKTLPVTVLAVSACAALLIDYRKIVSSCPSGCVFHTRLIENMLAVLADKSLLLNRRIGHLSKRSTREKLLSYLTEQAEVHGYRQFTIPFNRQELADYLCVERSAMSAVLSGMQKDGLLKVHRNQFYLKSPAEL